MIFLSQDLSNQVTAKNTTTQFNRLISAKGVNIYQKAVISHLEYVTILDLRQAKLQNLAGKISLEESESIEKQQLAKFWQDAVKHNTKKHQIKVIVNGTFFSTNNQPTGIAFGLKIQNHLITSGYGVANEYPGQIRTFAFNSSLNFASIQPYSPSIFENFSDVIGGLDIQADKSANKYLPRTFIGIKDSDKDGLSETVIIYSSNYARQIDASHTLRNFGATSQVMLDGGGSTGLIVDGKPLITTNRPIPHALAVYAGR
ncbi:phosphodiester glycosidase family protein [Calothrix sp. 336/3]|uniref:phosphodiester glycosidase family protein n=1 Tax=Calothrix sp. 336/3 TaxID=1337936 RepID=UPI000AA9C9F3|nr:phosphodiester glycosidase family protein [Calothrix sp. 336/3]